MQEEDDPERRREEEFHLHISSSSSTSSSSFLTEGEGVIDNGREGGRGREREEEREEEGEVRAAKEQLSRVRFPCTVRREPESGVEVKETKVDRVMDRERLEGSSMNAVNETVHIAKSNMSVCIILSSETDMTGVDELNEDKREIFTVSSGYDEGDADVSVYPERGREVVMGVLCTLSILSPSDARCSTPAFSDLHGRLDEPQLGLSVL